MPYCLYLRKSRADAEEEARGAGETLARHRAALTALAEQRSLNVTKEYAEIVSGESLASRPMAQRLLRDVERGLWEGVLVMEIERLARGDGIDQGIIAQTFKYSGALIVTPLKTYDPNDEFDEEYFEFGLFMSRREYKAIRRRLVRGRIASVTEGKYIGSVAPFGYERVKLPGEKGFTLAIRAEQSVVVQRIFRWYAIEGLGTPSIAERLNSMGLTTKADMPWARDSVASVLKNPVYTGKVKWGQRAQVKSSDSGRTVVSCPRSKEYLIAEGRHNAIIAQEVFDAAQQRFSLRKTPPCPARRALVNPLAGLVICENCGKHLVRRENKKRGAPARLLCPTPHCPTVSSELSIVERAITDALGMWLCDASFPVGPKKNHCTPDSVNSSLQLCDKRLKTLQTQLARACELAEQGVYTPGMFLVRQQEISNKITETKAAARRLREEKDAAASAAQKTGHAIPEAMALPDIFALCATARQKNDLYKCLLEKVVYHKSLRQNWRSDVVSDLALTLYPRLPGLSAHG